MFKMRRLKFDMDICTRPLFRKIIFFSLPLMFTGILQLLYNAADIIIVGRFADANAMAAVGSTTALVNLVINLFIGLSLGTLAAMAQAIGARDEQSADKIAHTSMLISFVGGIAIGIFGYFMAEKFLIMMKTPADILPLSTIYMKIFFIGMPFNLVYNFGASILRACGDTKNPLAFLTLAGLINVALNLFFVIVLKMSVEGVALATIIAQGISAILIVICLMKRRGYGKLRIKNLRINKKALFKILRIGLPAGIQSTIFSYSNVLIQSAINSMGANVMAGSAAAASVEGFIYTSMNAISQATLTFTGQNYGANKRKNCALVLMQTLLITSIIGIVMGVTAYLVAPWLLKIYNEDPEIIKYGVQRLLIIGTTYCTCGIMEVLVGSLRGIGHSFLPMLMSILGVCGVRILWIKFVFEGTGNLILLYLSYPVSWVLTSTIHFISLLLVKNRAFRKYNKQYSKVPEIVDLEKIEEIVQNS